MSTLDQHLSRIEFALVQIIGDTVLHPERYAPALSQGYRDALDAVQARKDMIGQNRQAVANALVLAEAESSLIPKGRFDK